MYVFFSSLGLFTWREKALLWNDRMENGVRAVRVNIFLRFCADIFYARPLINIGTNSDSENQLILCLES